MTTMVATAPLPHSNRVSVLSRIWASFELGRSRAQLRELPDHLLADIGVSRGQAHAESRRPSWELPAWWRN